VVLVLHAHLRGCSAPTKSAGCTSMLDCYLPLLDVLGTVRRAADVVVTPVLAAMLNDGPARERSRAFIEMARLASTAGTARPPRRAEELRPGPIVKRLGALAAVGHRAHHQRCHARVSAAVDEVPAAARAQDRAGRRSAQRMFG